MKRKQPQYTATPDCDPTMKRKQPQYTATPDCDPKRKVYVAGPITRREDCALAAALLNDAGIVVVSTWHDVKLSKEDALPVNIADLAKAELVLVVMGPGAKETYVEIGRALAVGKNVVVITEQDGWSFLSVRDQCVSPVPNLEFAIRELKRLGA
jgi:nucleoside 2-deoxyribosyltransferase